VASFKGGRSLRHDAWREAAMLELLYGDLD